MSIGTLHKKDSLFFRVDSGEAKDSAGKKYELSTTIGHAPIVRSRTTGLWFILSWADIINLAKEKGIDDIPARHAKPAPSMRDEIATPRMETINKASSEYGVGIAPALPLSAEEIEYWYQNAICDEGPEHAHTWQACLVAFKKWRDQALRAIELERQLAGKDKELEWFKDKHAKALTHAFNLGNQFEELEKQYHSTQQSLESMHECAEKAEGQVAEQDREIVDLRAALAKIENETIERCAKVVDDMHGNVGDAWDIYSEERADGSHNTLTNGAKAIRALEKEG